VGLVNGIEFTGNYAIHNFSAYANLSFQTAHGKGVESSQFNFDPVALAYIAENFIHLDHEGRVAASSGVSYLFQGTRLSADMIFGSGLRQDTPWLVPVPGFPGGLNVPNGDHTPSYAQFNLGVSHEWHILDARPTTARFDVINLFDKEYQIRSGSGVGVFAPQFGPRRGFFVGVSQAL
jgi:outer membrane receptor protein involved in Fe transport